MHVQCSEVSFGCHHGTSRLHTPLLFKHSTPEHMVRQKVNMVIIGC